MRDSAFTQVLAVDPTPRGLSFAILERGGRLIDWGGKRGGVGTRTNARCVADVAALIQFYRPDVLALERCSARESRRRPRVRVLIHALRRLAAREGVQPRHISPGRLRRVCTGNRRATKHDVARALADRFPELARALPPRRKSWMNEDHRINVFDAVGLAFVVIQESEQITARRT